MPTLLQSWLQNHAEFEAQGRKLAIYIGPGGNAGVIAGGCITALYVTKSLLPNASYIGSSVGAFCWMYTLIAEDYRGPTIFGQYFTDNRFFSAKRLLTGKPALDLNFVVDDILTHRIPIRYELAAQSAYFIQAVTTCSTGKPKLLPISGQDPENVKRILKITAAMPLLGRIHNEHDLADWDGWLIEPHLLEHLQQQGITDIIWISNRPFIEKLSLTTKLVWQRIIRRLTRTNPQLAEMVKARLTAGNFLAHPPAGLNLEVIEPHTNISGNCRNPATLFHALGTSYKNMASYLGHPNLPYPAEWQPWQHHMPQ